MAGKKDDAFITTTPPPGKPQGLLDAISEIQQYYVVERTGSEIHEEFLTLKGRLTFFEVGFKAALVSGLITALMTPFAIGVIQEYIPIFGSSTPSMFDKVFAVILSLSFAVGYSFFLATLGKYYIGRITKTAIRNLIAGLTAGGIVKAGLAFMFFHFLYFVVLQEETLATLLLKFRPIFKMESLNEVYRWLLYFRPVFLTSSFFIIVTTTITITIPIVSIILNSRKTRFLMEQENRWN